MTENQLKSAAAKFILKNSEGHRIPSSVMESIVSGAQSLFQIALDGIRSQVEEQLKNSEVSLEVISSVTSHMEDDTQYTKIFKGLETTYRQNKYIKDNFPFVVTLA